MFKRIIIVTVLSVLAYQTANAALQSERFFDNTGGLLDRISPLLVPSKNASDLLNVTLDNRGVLSKRSGYVALNTTEALGDATNGRYVTGGVYHDTAIGNDFFAVVAGTNIYRVSNTFGTTYSTVTGTVTVTASASNLAQATSLNDKAIFCNELDKPFYVGPTGNALALNTTSFSSATTCATNGSYLIVANTFEAGVSFPTRVRWSDIGNQNSFPANNYIDIEPSDGDRIVSIVNFEDKVFIMKKRSIYQLLVTGEDGANAFITRPLTRGIGAWAKNSVKVIPNVGVVFLAQNTVYTINDEGLSPIGDSIQTALSAMNRGKWKDAVGEVYPKRFQYWLAMSEDTNPAQKVLVYDYIQKAWTVYDFSTSVTMLAQAEDSTGETLMLMGDATGYHYKQDIGTADYPSNTKTAIDSYYASADLNFASPDITKTFKYLYLYSNALTSSTVTIEAATDFSALYDTPMSVDLGNIGAVYDTAVYDVSIYTIPQASITRIELNTSGKTIRLKFSNSTMDSALGIVGWSVVYKSENFNE